MAVATRHWYTYTADDHGVASFPSNNISMLIPDSEGTDTDNGWVRSNVTPGNKREVRFKPRHVIGVAPDGTRRKLMIGDVTANYWTGAATSWTAANGNTYTITGFVGEARTRES